MQWLTVLKVVVWVAWALCIPFGAWAVMGLVWQNHIDPRRKLFNNKLQEMLDKGDIWDTADLDRIYADEIVRDINAHSPLYWYRRWNVTYPLPKIAKQLNTRWSNPPVTGPYH